MQHLYSPTLESATVTRANIKSATSKKKKTPNSETLK